LTIGTKFDGIWPLLTFAYPFVGGTAQSHSVNLKSPGLYNLAFGADTSHSLTNGLLQGNTAVGGVQANYAQVIGGGWAQINMRDYHLAVYFKGANRSRTPYHTPGDVTIGTNAPGSHGAYLAMFVRNADNQAYAFDSGVVVTTSPIQDGLNMQVQEPGQTVYRFYKRGTQTHTQTQSSQATPTVGGAVFVGTNSISGTTWASLGRAMSPTQVVQFNGMINNYQAALGRAVAP
jgi:hypothetical protein